MAKHIGAMAAGIAIGLVLTGVLLYQEERDNTEGNKEDLNEKRNGLFAEISGNKVRTYEVRDGSFCGYSETRIFENRDKAVEWAVKETGAKIVIRDADDQDPDPGERNHAETARRAGRGSHGHHE